MVEAGGSQKYARLRASGQWPFRPGSYGLRAFHPRARRPLPAVAGAPLQWEEARFLESSRPTTLEVVWLG